MSFAEAQLPDPGLEVDRERTAVVITDPQNGFLGPDGVTWGLAGKSVTASGTVASIEALMKTAQDEGLPEDATKAMRVFAFTGRRLLLEETASRSSGRCRR